MNSYSIRQLEIAELLKEPSPEAIEQVLNIVGEAEQKVVKKEGIEASANTEAFIRLKIADETDWRKKAALCALLISKNLE